MDNTIYVKEEKTSSSYSKPIFDSVEKAEFRSQEQKLTVSPVVSEIASWYERVRNSMEYAEDEVLLRSAIERIIRRHLIIFKEGKDIAPSLVRELAWAKYVPSGSIPESVLEEIAKKIDLYLWLDTKAKFNLRLGNFGPRDYILQLLSVDIALLIGPDRETEALAISFIRILDDKIKIPALLEEERIALILVSVYKSFAKEDTAFLRSRLFMHFFGKISQDNKEKVVENFPRLVNLIEHTLNHPLAHKVYSFAKRNTAPFLILKDLMKENRNGFKTLIENREKLETSILEICERRYKGLRSKVRRAIIRSAVFLFATKALVALFIEGAFEKFFYGQVMWSAIAVNTAFPPILLMSSFLFMVTPDAENSKKIFKKVESILFDPDISEFDSITIKAEDVGNPYLNAIFIALWISVGIFVLVGIHSLLDFLHVHLLSQGVFIFFLAVVLFLVYRIRESARIYNVEEESLRWWTLIFDFLFMPLVHVGQSLTVAVAKINVFLMIFDLLIETPFKTLFSFFEQWFFFLRSQREKLD